MKDFSFSFSMDKYHDCVSQKGRRQKKKEKKKEEKGRKTLSSNWEFFNNKIFDANEITGGEKRTGRIN